MNWKLKSRVQNAVAALPSELSYRVYYFLQRQFGGYRESTPEKRLRAGVEIASRIVQHGGAVEGATFLEVGTGHQVNVPLALYLCGSREVVTVDLHRYLKLDLVRQDLQWLAANRPAVEAIFGPFARTPEFRPRFEILASWAGTPLQSLLDVTGIRYLAPADAARLELPDASVDYHISYTVLEHIPPETLAAILREGRRVLRPAGLFVHYVDFSDHFSHSDTSISPVNFLQFTEAEWLRWGGNRYMYQNRLRVDDFLALLEGMGLNALAVEPRVDPAAARLLAGGGLPLDPRFRDKPADVNATLGAWVVAA